MSASYLVALPAEILERVLLCLPSRDIVKMRTVNKHFRDLVRTSPTLQHRCELFGIGLIDNPRCPSDLTERRKLRKEYAHKWSDAASFVKNTREFPLDWFPGQAYPKTLGDGLFVSSSAQHGFALTFLRVPPIASREPLESWSIPAFSFATLGYIVYPPEDVVAVVELEGSRICTHFLNLRDGSPYFGPPSNAVACQWELPSATYLSMHREMNITSSRVMVHLSYQDQDRSLLQRCWSVLVWNWKTGDLVLNLSSSDVNEPYIPDVPFIFLDEFRIAATPTPSCVAGLTVFNTLIPQGRPGYLRQLGFPRDLRYQPIEIYVDHDRHLGTQNKHGMLVADPAQAVIVMRTRGPTITLLVMRMQALIERTCSTRTDFLIPWDEWTRDAVAIEIQTYSPTPFTIVHGAQVMFTERFWTEGRAEKVYTFDFGQRNSLPFRGGAGVTKRKVVLEDGASPIFQSGQDLDLAGDLDLLSLGDGSLFRLGNQVRRNGSEWVFPLELLELV